jgi:ABC-type sulfate transport system permease component
MIWTLFTWVFFLIWAAAVVSVVLADNATAINAVIGIPLGWAMMGAAFYTIRRMERA